MQRGLFKSFFMGGFECSSQRRANGERLDLLKSTAHDDLAETDFGLLKSMGISTVRSGIRWHRCEPEPGRYNFASELPLLRAARQTNTQVIWDLFHYGWPDFLDIFDTSFPERFATFAAAFARLAAAETPATLWFSPVNEISFMAYAGADKGFLNPFANGRGDELKVQLVRAALAAMQHIRVSVPAVRFVHPEPVIHIVPHAKRPQDAAEVEAYRQSQFAVWDMLAGRLHPELGGSPSSLDVLGLNYYVHNQWVHNIRRPLSRYDPRYRPLREIIAEVYQRYRRPMIIAETGIEGRRRPSWLAYVAGEVRAAIQAGIPLHGLCWYPITDYYGWADDRRCPTGLLSLPGEDGSRTIYRPLAEEIARQQRLLAEQERALVLG